jgi:ribonuclease HI
MERAKEREKKIIISNVQKVVTTSSLTMEVMTVTRAMAWLETQTFTDVCFLGDSMSMLRKIENDRVPGEIKADENRFHFYPHHAGVRGNERADRLAGKATMESGRSIMDQVGREVAREERFSGSQRRIVSQHRTGVVSRFKLRDILKRRSEPLWTEEYDVQ